MTAFEYYTELDGRLESLANENLAIPMKKYMKNHSEFYGIKSDDRKMVVGEFKKDFGILKPDEIDEFVDYCWNSPYRELQYTCMELIDLEKNPPKERLSTYEKMVLAKSWWDSVDYISPNLMGKYFKLYPEHIADKTLGYVNSGELWLQRSALLFQLKYGLNTDLDLLFSYCTMLSSHKDFFIRKAIGWSLRQAARKYPNEIISYVENNSLSNLSVKEAMKHLK